MVDGVPLSPAVQARPRLLWAATGVFLVACALPLALLGGQLAGGDTCQVPEDGDCWAAGMAAFFLMVMAPFALVGFILGTITACRLAAGTALTLTPSSWQLLQGATWGLVASPLLVVLPMGGIVAFAAWWIAVVLLGKLACQPAQPPAAGVTAA